MPASLGPLTLQFGFDSVALFVTHLPSGVVEETSSSSSEDEAFLAQAISFPFHYTLQTSIKTLFKLRHFCLEKGALKGVVAFEVEGSVLLPNTQYVASNNLSTLEFKTVELAARLCKEFIGTDPKVRTVLVLLEGRGKGVDIMHISRSEVGAKVGALCSEDVKFYGCWKTGCCNKELVLCLRAFFKDCPDEGSAVAYLLNRNQ